jgi:gas vesicle structural protein
MSTEGRNTVAGAMASGSLVADLNDNEQLSFLEIVDHVLNQGLVISGEITIAVAEIDLVFVGLNVLLGSVDTIDRVLTKRNANTPDESKSDK